MPRQSKDHQGEENEKGILRNELGLIRSTALNEFPML